MRAGGVKQFISLRAVIAGVEITLLCVIGALCAILVLRLLTPVGPIGSLSVLTGRVSSGKADMPVYDIFWPSNQVRQAGNIGPWRLHGVSFRMEGPTAILSQGKGKPQLVFKKGEALDTNTRVSDIGADFVVLSRGGEETRLYLDDAPPVDTPSSRTDAAARGVVLPGPLDISILAPYGLKAGDTLLSINGTSVSRSSDVKAFLSLQASSEPIRVRILRDAQVIEKVLRP